MELNNEISNAFGKPSFTSVSLVFCFCFCLSLLYPLYIDVRILFNKKIELLVF